MLIEFQTTPYTSQTSEEPTPGCRCSINPQFVVSVYELKKDKWDQVSCTVTTNAMDEGTNEYHIVRGSFDEVHGKLNV